VEIVFNDTIGYIPKFNIIFLNQNKSFTKSELYDYFYTSFRTKYNTLQTIINAKKSALQQKQAEERFDKEMKEWAIKREKQLIKKFGKKIAKDIQQGYIWIGMTKDMLFESWGKPSNINKTVTSYSVHEQMIYGTSYVYVENGKVTSWQTHE